MSFRSSAPWVTRIRVLASRRCGPWRSLEAVELATLEWLDWFNDRRLFEPIATVHTAEAEARYHVQLEELPMAA